MTMFKKLKENSERRTPQRVSKTRCAPEKLVTFNGTALKSIVEKAEEQKL